METIVYDVYDFKSLESDDSRSQAIDLTECAYEDEHRIEIRMTALTSKFYDGFSDAFIMAVFSAKVQLKPAF